MTNTSILMTGNPTYGLAQAFKALYPETRFASRSTNPAFDLRKATDQEELAKLALDFNVFINNSYVDHFVQAELARKVWTNWRKSGRTGYLINVGSTVTDLIRPDNRMYPISKGALSDLSRRLYLHSIWEDSKIRVTYLSYGGIATSRTLETWPHYNHMDASFCAGLLQQLVMMPENVNIDILQASPVQPKARRKIKRENHEKPKQNEADDNEFLVADF